MMTARLAGTLGLGLCLAAPCLLALTSDSAESAKQTAAGQEVVAEVSGQPLTMADLQQKEGQKLLQAQYQYYLQQKKAVEDLINERLLSDEAARQHITVEQLLTNVYKDVKEPTEDQLQVYYEGTDSTEPYQAVRQEVLQHIRELRRNKARTAFIEKLRAAATVNVVLLPPVANVNIQKAYTQGPATAPVVMVEFADYECPYCQKVNPQLQQLKKEYGDKLTIVYKDFPLPMHHNSQKAAEAARCAGEQGKFWEFHDVLYRTHATDPQALKEHARNLKLDGDVFDKCLDSGAESAAVKKDFEEAKGLGLSGTPSFFLNDHFFSGVIDYTALKGLVDQQLALQARPRSQPVVAADADQTKRSDSAIVAARR